MYKVVAVDSREAESLEPLGTKRKFWFTDPHGRRMLFKAEERGTGEDWAERVSTELCGLLGLPHVRYELAIEMSTKNPGVVCENCAPPFSVLVHGNQMLTMRDSSYPLNESRKYRVREHTIEAVSEVLKRLDPVPPPWSESNPTGIESSLDVFIGYVMLDAWIANQDRHHENWAALLRDDEFYLAPTFDHGASMARNLSDVERKDRLISTDVRRQIGHFARRAKSAFYADLRAESPMTTLAAWQGFSLESPNASTIWKERLRAIEDEVVMGLLEKVPPDRLSGIGREFTFQLLAENKQRILDGTD